MNIKPQMDEAMRRGRKAAMDNGNSLEDEVLDKVIRDEINQELKEGHILVKQSPGGSDVAGVYDYIAIALEGFLRAYEDEALYQTSKVSHEERAGGGN